MERIGIRELRQNASVYVERVKAGESVEITQRGELVAVMSPPRLSPIERLVAEGQATLGTGVWDDTPPFPADEHGPSLGSILAEMRADER